MRILLANPRGFCAGVDYAIKIVRRALALFGAPIYVRHQIVHNAVVVHELSLLGALFVETIDVIPINSIVIFSAHGVSQKIRLQAKQKKLKIFDATCPLVTKVHMEVVRYSRLGYECILIGHAGHPEIEGTLGQYDNPDGGIYLVESKKDVLNLNVKNVDRLAYVTQTTLSVDDTAEIVTVLKKQFPCIIAPKKEDICYATQNRQEAVKALAKESDVILVVGASNSSNSNRLKEVAERIKPAYLINSPEDINPVWLQDKQTIGVTAGASVPETVIQQVIAQLKTWGADDVQSCLGQEETITFRLPRELEATA